MAETIIKNENIRDTLRFFSGELKILLISKFANETKKIMMKKALSVVTN